MNDLVTRAAWVLSATFALAFVYELYRATAKAGVSRHDNMKVFAAAPARPLPGRLAADAVTFLSDLAGEKGLRSRLRDAAGQAFGLGHAAH